MKDYVGICGIRDTVTSSSHPLLLEVSSIGGFDIAEGYILLLVYLSCLSELLAMSNISFWDQYLLWKYFPYKLLVKNSI